MPARSLLYLSNKKPPITWESASKKELLMSAAQSKENADYLRSKGISIAEVFHQDKVPKVLRACRYIRAAASVVPFV